MNIPDNLINWIAEKIMEQETRIKGLEAINQELARQVNEATSNTNLLMEENKTLIKKTALLSSELEVSKYETEQARKKLEEEYEQTPMTELFSNPILDHFYSISGVAELLGQSTAKTIEQEAQEAQDRVLQNDEFDGELK